MKRKNYLTKNFSLEVFTKTNLSKRKYLKLEKLFKKTVRLIKLSNLIRINSIDVFEKLRYSNTYQKFTC